MPKLFVLKRSIVVRAPIERCFLLSTHLEVVQQELGMRAIAGTRHGRVALGDRIVWRGWKFGMLHLHESWISGFEPPRFFQDTMVRGRFTFFQHDHRLSKTAEGTLLEDEVRFSLPFGWAGALVGRMILVVSIERLMRRRLLRLKRLAEGEGWHMLIPSTEPTSTS